MAGSFLRALALLAAVVGAPAAAQTLDANVERFVTPSRVIRTGDLIGPSDLMLRPGPSGIGLTDPAQAVGLEARATLYPGRPVSLGDFAPPALVERNQIVTIRFRRGGLLIETDGRAMDRGSNGRRIRVMNLTTRATVVARVIGPETVEVGG